MATKLPYVLPFEDGSVVAAILLKAQGLPETEQIATKTELQQATAYLATLDNSTMAPQSATVKRTTDNLQTQINNIVRAPESGGDVGAEVYQARIDADGTSYQTLKERLDAEETGVEQAIVYVTPFDIEQGVWEDGVKKATTDRIRVNKKLHLRLGSELSINPHGLFVSVHQYADESATEHLASGWIGGDDNIIDIQIKRPVVTISVANTDSYETATPITPSDYTCAIYAINTDLPERMSTFNDDINEITEHQSDIDEMLDMVNLSSNIPGNLFDFRTALEHTGVTNAGAIVPNDHAWITDYILIPEGAGYLKFSKSPYKIVFLILTRIISHIHRTHQRLYPIMLSILFRCGKTIRSYRKVMFGLYQVIPIYLTSTQRLKLRFQFIT